MKSKFLILSLAAVMTSLGGTAFAGEKKTVFNNRGQVTATVNAVTAQRAPAANVQKKLIWNNRGQLIAVVPAVSR